MPRFNALRDYWDGKRAGRPMPGRADIDPLELREHLGNLVMIEALPAADDFRYRLIGTQIVARYGRDSTGKTVRELYAAAAPLVFDWTMTVLQSVVRSRAPVYATNRLRAVSKDFLTSHQLHLPLADDGATVTMILCETLFEPVAPAP